MTEVSGYFVARGAPQAFIDGPVEEACRHIRRPESEMIQAFVVFTLPVSYLSIPFC
jgi:hypothetical protein